jgi:hypothetical protein
MDWVDIRITTFLGISYRLDALERHNEAAGAAMGGAVIAIGASYEGANVGNGPGWWIVIFCAILTTASLLCLWLIYELITHVSESICIERDYGSGMRLMDCV